MCYPYKQESHEMRHIFCLMLVCSFFSPKIHAVNSNHYCVTYFERDELKGGLAISKVMEEGYIDICKTRKMDQDDFNIVNALLLDRVTFIDSGYYGELHESSFRVGIEILNIFLANGSDEMATNLLKEFVDHVKCDRRIRTRNCDIDDFAWKYRWISNRQWIDQIDGDFRQELMERYPEVKDQIEKLIPDNRPLNIVLAEKVTNLWNNWFHQKPVRSEKLALLTKEE